MFPVFIHRSYVFSHISTAGLNEISEARGLAQENQRLKKSLHDSEAVAKPCVWMVTLW